MLLFFLIMSQFNKSLKNNTFIYALPYKTVHVLNCLSVTNQKLKLWDVDEFGSVTTPSKKTPKTHQVSAGGYRRNATPLTR